MTQRGRFVVLEGVEGSGKTTQINLLVQWLEGVGVPHVTAREPGGTPVGEAIREIVQDRPGLEIPAETELLLYVAARAAFVRRIVEPALARGQMVVADRYSLSTYAYQGYGRELDPDQVRRIDRFATGGLEPDLYLFLDVPVEGGMARREEAGARDDRIEGEGREFLERVRRGYRALVQEDPAAVVVDGTAPPQEVHAAIREVMKARFPETFSSSRV